MRHRWHGGRGSRGDEVGEAGAEYEPGKTNGGIPHPVYGDDQFNIVRLPEPAIAPKKEVGT